ncbi:hypothetical protein LCGC14_0323070 [marine sediment metagenome]|uniref:Uncharacterized protein n=1 Tax=marine sediment metagenome TaxID=412755 RepID=A0A0F9WQR8_9ZZZZ
MSDTVGRFAWHCHHDMLLEILVEPHETRVAHITGWKRVSEIATRLRLFELVQGKLPDEVIAAGKNYIAARENWVVMQKRGKAALERYVVAREKCATAIAGHADEINALHAAECPDCPWNGVTIFPE